MPPSSPPACDVAIVGAGITGLGIYERACRAGLSAVLIERGAAGGATTAVTSGLFHGGLRYLPYDVATSYKMCQEIRRLREEAPGLMRRQPFVWPVYRGDPAGPGVVGALLDFYDLFGELRGSAPHSRLSAEEAGRLVPGLSTHGLAAAFLFEEWRADVPGLVDRLRRAGAAAGGRLLERSRVVAFDGEPPRASEAVPRRLQAAVVVADNGRPDRIPARVFVNAAGPWADEVARLAGARAGLRLRAGAHLVFEREPPAAGLIFAGPGGRYVGLYPREGECWVGPTDVEHGGGPDEARPGPGDERGLRVALERVLPGWPRLPGRMVAGLRPIFAQGGVGALLSRDHRVLDHEAEGAANLLTVVGGKLTTFGPMAADALDAIGRKLGRPPEARAPGAQDGAPWRWLGTHSRGASLALSGAMLGWYLARRAAGRSGERRGLEPVA